MNPDTLDQLDTNLPADPTAERAILGALMWDPRLHDNIADIITAADFWTPAHEQVWAAITELVDNGQACDAITVAAHMQEAGTLDQAGGHLALVEMYETAIPANALAHARIVADRATQRRTIAAAARIQQLGHRGDPTTMLEDAQALLDPITGPLGRTEARSGADVLADVVDSLDQPDAVGLPTPWPSLDRALVGMAPGRLYAVGARPGVGKSLLLQGLAVHWARHHQQPALLATCEMPAKQVMRRVLAQCAQVSLGKILDPTHRTADDNRRIDRAVADMTGWVDRLRICDDEDQSVAGIRAEARAMQRAGGVGIVCVDYLQLLKPPPATRRDRNREQEVAAMSRQLKALAMGMDLPVVVASQLNRESTKDKRPTLANLRESGAIEQDCDVVLLLHQPEPESDPNGLDVVVAKNRDGDTTTAHLVRQGWVSSIADPSLGRAA